MGKGRIQKQGADGAAFLVLIFIRVIALLKLKELG
jgi:hypothetical protein